MFLFAFKSVVGFTSPFITKLLNINSDSVQIVSLAIIFFLLCVVELVALYVFVKKYVDLRISSTLLHSIFASIAGGVIMYLGLNILKIGIKYKKQHLDYCYRCHSRLLWGICLVFDFKNI